MALVESLLSAIVRSDGDALVLHVGERPYVVAASGQVELSARALTLDAMAGMLGQLLSPEAENALEELGAVEDELPPLATIPGERYAVVAARGGGDIWIEIRRHREITQLPDPVAIEEPLHAAPVAIEEPLLAAPVVPAYRARCDTRACASCFWPDSRTHGDASLRGICSNAGSARAAASCAAAASGSSRGTAAHPGFGSPRDDGGGAAAQP